LRAEIFPRRVYIDCKASDQRDFSGKLKLPIAVGKCLLHPPTVGDINVDADDSLSVPLAIVGDKTARFDPSHPAVWEHNAILKSILALPVCKGLSAKAF
jgi:hypothetical protein